MKKVVVVMIAVLCMPWAGAIAGGTTPVQISIWNPVQVFPDDYDVAGFRCGLYSRNRHVYGLDVGVMTRADESSGGIQVNLGCSTVSGLGVDFIIPDLIGASEPDWSVVDNASKSNKCASYTGLQLAYVVNYADDMRGIQLAGVGNYAVRLRGCQIGGVNECRSGRGWQLGILDDARHDFGGIQGAALFNFCGEEMHGLQIGGLWNSCDGEMHGLQIGVVNIAGKMTGVQVGLINIIKDSAIPFIPLVNMMF